MSQGIETSQAAREASGARRVRPLPRGVRGRRRVQALAGQDRDRGGRPPVLPADHEPPPAAHQRRLCGGVPAGPERGGGPARLLIALGMSVGDVSGKRPPTSPPRLSHPAPVFHGDTLFCESRCSTCASQSKPDRGVSRSTRVCTTGQRAGGRVQARGAGAAQAASLRRRRGQSGGCQEQPAGQRTGRAQLP